MKIACVTTHDIHNSSEWSKYRQGICGASRKITQTLESTGFDMSYLGPLKRPRSPITRLKWLFYRHIHQKDYYSWADSIILNGYARQVQGKLNRSDADIIFCPEDCIPISHIKVDRPLVLWTDTTIASLIDFYDHLCNICNETRQNIYDLERSALEKCSLVILTSDWSAEFLHKTYGFPKEKIRVIPRGSNKERTVSIDDVHNSIRLRNAQKCVLTFVGTNWSRKGGDLALAVAERLNQQGLPTVLQIIGCHPKLDENHDFVENLGFLRHSNTEELKIFEQALLRSHFLILPARAEHCAIALSEANSYGVPCLTTDVGGIPTIVQEGRNGRTFSKDSTTDDYCDYVMRYMNDLPAYHELALSSLREFETRLSWDVAQEKACNLFRDLVN
jgi:glycosyltransferase involved in cell wall biosynthesis